jgi:pyruvate/2-oxoglutarate dehydrogenase complex dihydrolipoamide acyltransferase (E2) component
MRTGTIASWTLKEGDSFAAGDVLCSIETDKASVDFEAQDDGILAKILRTGPSAQDIAVGTPICVVIEDLGDLTAFADFVLPDAAPAAAASPVTSTDAAMSTPIPATDPLQTRSVTDDFLLLPSARHLSHSKGVDATGLAGSGKGGRVTKGDVLAALANGTHMPPLSATPVSAATPAVKAAAVPVTSPAVAPAPPLSMKDFVNLTLPTIESEGSFQDVPNDNMRKIIARRLTESKSQVPHYYTSMEIELDNVLALRKKLANDHGVKVSVNDLIIRSSALALRDVPEVNATYDSKTNQVSIQNRPLIFLSLSPPQLVLSPQLSRLLTDLVWPTLLTKFATWQAARGMASCNLMNTKEAPFAFLIWACLALTNSVL